MNAEKLDWMYGLNSRSVFGVLIGNTDTEDQASTVRIVRTLACSLQTS